MPFGLQAQQGLLNGFVGSCCARPHDAQSTVLHVERRMTCQDLQLSIALHLFGCHGVYIRRPTSASISMWQQSNMSICLTDAFSIVFH
jgi:hypothetical protein